MLLPTKRFLKCLKYLLINKATSHKFGNSSLKAKYSANEKNGNKGLSRDSPTAKMETREFGIKRKMSFERQPFVKGINVNRKLEPKWQ